MTQTVEFAHAWTGLCDLYNALPPNHPDRPMIKQWLNAMAAMVCGVPAIAV